MKKMGSIWLFLSLVLCLASPVLAQQPGFSLVLEQADLTAYPHMTVQFSAWRSDGSPLPELRPQDFSLQEDDGPIFQPEAVTANTRAALSVVLVVDISGSMAGQPLTDAKVAAARFLDRLTPGDQAALIAFSDGVDPNPEKLNPQRELGFTSNLRPLYDGIEKLKAGGNTHLYNALTKAIRLTADLPSGHRAVLLLSDGKNEPPQLGDLEAPIREARQANLPIIVIGLGNQIDEPYLRRLAAETGGIYRGAPTSGELAGLFTDSAALLKTRYQLSYTSKLAGDGKTHVLKVTLNNVGSGVTAKMVVGPLPRVAPTPTATFTPQPTATATFTSTPLPPTYTATPEPTATPVPPPQASGDWGLYAGVGVLVLIGALVLVLVLRRKPSAPGEKCARCGSDRTSKAGPCPVCGETKRLPEK